MPWVNRQSGQIMQGTQQQRPMPSAPSPSFNPLSGIRQGLNLGGKFLGGTGGNVLGSLGSLAGLGLGIANKSPGGIVGSLGSLAGFAAPLAQGLGFGTVGSTLGGSLSAGLSSLAGGGSAVGAGAGAAGTGFAGGLSSVAGPLAAFALPALLASMMPSGQPKKDIKAEGKVIASANNDIRNAMQTSSPIDIDRFRVTGSYTKNAQGQLTSTKRHGIKQLAAYLNRGIEVPKVTKAIGGSAESYYVIPMEVTQGSFQAGQLSLRPNPDDPLHRMMIAIPEKEIRVTTDDVTGEVTYGIERTLHKQERLAPDTRRGKGTNEQRRERRRDRD